MVYVFTKKGGHARGQIDIKGVENDYWVTDEVLVAATLQTVFPTSIGKWLHDNGHLRKIKKEAELDLPLSKKMITCTTGQVRVSLGDDKGKWTDYFSVTIYFSDAAIAELGSPGLWTGTIGSADIESHAEIRALQNRVELRWKDTPASSIVQPKSPK